MQLRTLYLILLYWLQRSALHYKYKYICSCNKLLLLCFHLTHTQSSTVVVDLNGTGITCHNLVHPYIYIYLYIVHKTNMKHFFHFPPRRPLTNCQHLWLGSLYTMGASLFSVQPRYGYSDSNVRNTNVGVLLSFLPWHRWCERSMGVVRTVYSVRLVYWVSKKTFRHNMLLNFQDARH